MSKIMTFEVSTLGDLEDAIQQWRDAGADSITSVSINGDLDRSVIALVNVEDGEDMVVNLMQSAL